MFTADEGEKDHMVVGDFNTEFSSPALSILSSDGYQTAIDEPCSKTNLPNCSFVIRKYAGIIDHVIFPDPTAEFSDGSGKIATLPSIKTYLKTQSDHLPVWARFYADIPDDD